MAFRLETYKMAAAQRGYPINVVSTKPSTEEDKSVLALIKNIGGKLDMMGQKSQNVEKQAREDHYSKYRLRQSSDRGIIKTNTRKILETRTIKMIPKEKISRGIMTPIIRVTISQTAGRRIHGAEVDGKWERAPKTANR